MKIAVAQTRPRAGDIAANLAVHLQRIELGLAHGAELVVFPELSLTGYEPRLAGALALELGDPRLDPIAALGRSAGATIVVGMPTPGPGKPRISAAILRPDGTRDSYGKHHLHPDELPYFSRDPGVETFSRDPGVETFSRDPGVETFSRDPGVGPVGLVCEAPRIALAICYELSVPAHAEAAIAAGARVYLSCVAKSATGVVQASQRLSALAREHGIVTIMANCVGPADDFVAAGHSAAWDARGCLLARLDAHDEGMLVVDVATASAVTLPALAGG